MIDYNLAARITSQFGGALYALDPRQCEHVWGLLDPWDSLCRRYNRYGIEAAHKTGHICSWCLSELEVHFCDTKSIP